MSASSRENHPMRGNRGKAKITSGWTAFDHKQRRKQQGLESENDIEPYPLLSGPPSIHQSLFSKTEVPLEKPFSSVVVTSMDFPSLMDAENRILEAQNIEPTATTKAYQKLNYLHPWADKSLIQDVLAGVNNNVDEALFLLESMLISENKDDNNQKEDMSLITNDPVDESYHESKDEASSMLLLDAAKSMPIEYEPEWEEDDVYLIHRNDAMRMIRSASRHSKASNDAYLRGDHISARHFSQKAQEEWAAAEKLNAKAAKEILALRNSKNDLWTLDLHGLHATEAVEALRERLQIVESLMSINFSATPNGVHKESTTHVKMEKFGRQQPSVRKRPKSLEVITGKGNHSRDAAALPSTIRNFLSENGYHFDETRPGVVMIKPKFRPQ